MSSRAGEDEFDSRFTMLGGENMPQPTPGWFKISVAAKVSAASPCDSAYEDTAAAAGSYG
jgi:hypothetical protein